MRIAVMILLAIMAAPALAQEDAPNLSDNWYMVVKEGHFDEFEQALKSHIAFREENGDPRSWQVYSPVIGGKLNYYIVRACCFDWADQDSYREWAMEAGAGEHFNNTVDQHVEKYMHFMGSIDMENSHWDDEQGPWRYFGVTRWWPKEEAMGINAIKDRMSQQAIEMGWENLWSWEWRIGGTPQLTLVSPFKDYADMEPPEVSFYEAMSEQLGGEEEAQEMFAEFGSKFAKSSYTVYAHRDDLSMEMDDE